MKLETAIERAFNRINLIGSDCDVYAILYQYKAIRELDEKAIDKIYDYIVERLGFTKM